MSDKGAGYNGHFDSPESNGNNEPTRDINKAQIKANKTFAKAKRDINKTRIEVNEARVKAAARWKDYDDAKRYADKVYDKLQTIRKAYSYYNTTNNNTIKFSEKASKARDKASKNAQVALEVYTKAKNFADKMYNELKNVAKEASNIKTKEKLIKSYNKAKIEADKAYDKLIATEKAYDEARAVGRIYNANFYFKIISDKENAYDEAKSRADKIYNEAIIADRAYCQTVIPFGKAVIDGIKATKNIHKEN